jgi:hypothetical protein
MGPIALSLITDQPRLDGREGLEARQIGGRPSRCTSVRLSKFLGFTWEKYDTSAPFVWPGDSKRDYSASPAIMVDRGGGHNFGRGRGQGSGGGREANR